MIDFFIPGTPCGQPRPKFSLGHVYTPSGPIDAWKASIMWGCKAHRPTSPITGPVNASLCFYFPRPKYHFKKDGQLKPEAPIRHIVKPDRDNLDKAVLDCLTKCGFWIDDCQVCDGEVKKVYGEVPGVRICITPLNH